MSARAAWPPNHPNRLQSVTAKQQKGLHNPMEPQSVVSVLKSYVANELLEGQEIGLDSTTPLLEWGVINSIEIARLVAYIRDQFGTEIPAEMVIAKHFKDIDSLARLVIGQAVIEEQDGGISGSE